MADMKYSIKISALDAFTKPLKGMAKAVKGFSTKSGHSLDKVADKTKLNRSRLQSMLKPLRDINKAIQTIGNNTGLDKGFKSLSSGLGHAKKFSFVLGGSLAGAVTGMSLISQQATKHDALAKSVGLSGKSLSAWGGLVGKMGFDTEHVVDLVEEMNNKFGELSSLGEMSSATDSLKMLGLRFKDIKKLKPEEQFQKIMEAAAGLDNQQVAASAVDMLLGGEANKVLSHLRVESKATGKSIQDLLKEQERLNLSSAEGMAGHAKMAGASSKLFAVMKSGLFEVVGILAETLSPLITKLTDYIIENFDSIRASVSKFGQIVKVVFSGSDKDIDELIDSSDGLVKTFLRIVKHVGAVKLVLGTLAAVIVGPLLLGIGLMTIAFIKLGVAMLANPIGLIIVAIVALGAVIYSFRNEFVAVWESIKTFFVGFIAGLVSAISSFKDTFIAIWGSIVNFFYMVDACIYNSFIAVWEGIKAFFGAVCEGIKTTFLAVWDTLKEAFSAFWEFIKEYNAFSIGIKIMQSLWNGLQNVWGNISAWFQEKLASLIDFLPDFVKEEMGLNVKTENKEDIKTAVEHKSALPQGVGNRMSGSITVDFRNAPPNMSVQKGESDKGLDLNTDVGYNNFTPS